MITEPEMAEVELLGLPVQSWLRASAHQEALLREFDIIRAGQSRESVPNRLNALVDEIVLQFGDIGASWRRRIEEAGERGEESLDLSIRLPVGSAIAARRLAEMMREVDEYCLSGDILTLATPPDIADFRTWLLEEIAGQIAGRRPPSRWGEGRRQDPEVEGGAGPSPTVERARTGVIVFDGDLDLSSVSVLRDQIHEHVRRGDATITIDLTGVHFIDSVGISLLVSAYARLREEGMEARLLMSPRLKPLIEMSGLVEVLRPEFGEP